MARRSSIDTRDLQELYRDLSKAPGRIQRAADGVLKKGAVKIKAGMRRDFRNVRGERGHKGYYPQVAGTIDFESIPDGYEIGVNPNAQRPNVGLRAKGGSGTPGELANILAFGSVNNDPVVDHTAALRRETPHVLREFGEVAEESVLGKRDGTE